MSGYILAIDQGTSSTKTVVFNHKGDAVARASVALETKYYGEGFVEQDPEAIYQNVIASITQCLKEYKLEGGDITAIKAIGISNQRETFIVWDESGTPLYHAVVWQCKRSVAVCERLKAEGFEDTLRSKTGLIVDPYFSGSKLVWLYENEPAVKEAIENGKAWFGTIDTWLLYKFTNGRTYKTDYTNASRTMFFNLETLSWDREILQYLGFENLNLPEIQPSSSFFGDTDLGGLLPATIPVTAMIGDSHAAAFGEGCFDAGSAKATLGTGCSILMNAGNKLTTSEKGMVATICWSTEEQVAYALEGVIVSCGATLEWLKNELGLLKQASEAEDMALAVEDNGGVYIVPAF
ncbi:MAG: carbohydrate kinase, partial [Pedobacter sp.]